MKQSSPVRIRDVAAEAGVSATTVSHVLNDVAGKRITDETRRRVREAALRLGYSPNAVARSLRTQRSQLIALVSDEIATTPFAVHIIRGAQEAASKQGWLLIVANTGTDEQLEASEIQALRQRQVDGFLYARMFNDQVTIPLSLSGAPTVLLDATSSDLSVSSVVPDEVQGGRTATQALIDHGHKRIGFINNIDDIPASAGRLAGYRAALSEAGLTFNPDYVVEDTTLIADANLHGPRTLLDLPDRPTGIFCFNDQVAMKTYHAASQRGLRIPDDLSVVGFDNLDLIAEGLRPGLTTVALPHYEMGVWAVETLIHQIEDAGQPVIEQALMTCPLVERGSLSPPKIGWASSAADPSSPTHL
jgi:LacI family transcriptional regulator